MYNCTHTKPRIIYDGAATFYHGLPHHHSNSFRSAENLLLLLLFKMFIFVLKQTFYKTLYGVKSQRRKSANLFLQSSELGLPTEKNANFRKILILFTNISKIIICLSELCFDACSNIYFFVTN